MPNVIIKDDDEDIDKHEIKETNIHTGLRRGIRI